MMGLHFSKWNEATIREAILTHLKMYETKRMPTKSELVNVNNGVLANAISKNGGFDYWAKKMGLGSKVSQTSIGRRFEVLFMDFLKQRLGVSSQQMSVKFPYDVLVENVVKVDVKVSFPYKGKTGEFYTFNLEQGNRKSDLLVCYCMDDSKIVKKVYVIPSVVMQGKKQLSIGKYHSVYDTYIDRYDIIKTYMDFYKSMLSA